MVKKITLAAFKRICQRLASAQPTSCVGLAKYHPSIYI